MQKRTETSQSPGTSPGHALRRERPGGRSERGPSRRKVCQFCHDHVREIDYKDASRFMKRYTRHMALLPYTAEHMRGM